MILLFARFLATKTERKHLSPSSNAVLDFHDDQRISQVSILNPYQLPKLKGGKVPIIDVKPENGVAHQIFVKKQYNFA